MGIKKDGKLIDKCLDKIEEGESFFVLRGQDHSSPEVILEWLKINPQIRGYPSEKFDEAIACIKKMTEWSRKGKTKPAN